MKIGAYHCFLKFRNFGKSQNFRKLLILLLLLGGQNVFSGFALDLKSYYEETNHYSNAEFLEAFPYEIFLQDFKAEQIKDLEDLRNYLNSLDRPGDKFLYELGKHYRRTLGSSLVDLLNQKNLADQFLTHANKIPDGMIFELLGQDLLEQIAFELESQIKKGDISEHGADSQALILYLEEQQYLLNLPQSNWEKLQFHASEGNWGYIFDRALKEAWQYYDLILWGLVIFIALLIRYREHLVARFKRLTTK